MRRYSISVTTQNIKSHTDVDIGDDLPLSSKNTLTQSHTRVSTNQRQRKLIPARVLLSKAAAERTSIPLSVCVFVLSHVVVSGSCSWLSLVCCLIAEK